MIKNNLPSLQFLIYATEDGTEMPELCTSPVDDLHNRTLVLTQPWKLYLSMADMAALESFGNYTMSSSSAVCALSAHFFCSDFGKTN